MYIVIPRTTTKRNYTKQDNIKTLINQEINLNNFKYLDVLDY